jgi:uncharacterized iron-regulated membrane protein
MSVTAEPDTPPRDRETATAPCEHCGAPLRPDQEWCLECGAARTLVHRPPDWRIAATIVAGVVLLALIGFAIALINLSNASNHNLATTSTVTASPTTPTPTTSATTRPSAVPGWPIGLPGWTVVVYSTTTRTPAVTKARQLAAAGLHVGVLSTSRHPSGNMPAGRFAVFTGRYPTQQGARARAKVLRTQGYRARARRVGRPGGP